MVAMTFPVFADLPIVPLPLAPVIGIHSARWGTELQLQLQHAERFSTWKLHDPIGADPGDLRRRGHRMTAGSSLFSISLYNPININQQQTRFS